MLKKPIVLALAWACSLGFSPAAAGAGLSSEQVKAWLSHRIALAHIQNEMKANPQAYTDLPRAYALKESAYLARHGYSVAEFKDQEIRIYNAADAMAMHRQQQQQPAARDRASCEAEVAEDLRESTAADPDMEQQLAELRQLGLPEAQIEEIRRAQAQLDTVAREAGERAAKTCASEDQSARQTAAHDAAFIEASRPDWPGVRPWLEPLEHFLQWYAGNDTHPEAPRLD